MMLHLRIEMGLVLYIAATILQKKNPICAFPQTETQDVGCSKSSPDDARKYLAEQRYQAAS
jgi:hypothetical protein